MGPDFVVSFKPFLREIADLGQRLEQIGAEGLLPIGPIEAFDIAVLVRLAGLDVARFDTLAVCTSP